MANAVPVQAQQAPIKLGVFLSLTGPSAAGASPNKLGYEMAVKDINDAGGINGRKLTIVYADEQGDPTVAVGEIKRLVYQEKVDIVVGTNISQTTLAALPVLTEAKVASVSMTGSTAITTVAGPYQFSVLPNGDTLGRQMALYLADVIKAKSPVVLYDDAAATKSAIEAFKATLAEKGVRLAAEQQYKFHPSDVSPQLLSLRRARPDFLVLYSASQDDVGLVQKNLLEIGWDIPEMGSLAAAVSPDLVTRVAGPDAYSNMIAQTFARFTYCPAEGSGDPVIGTFIKKVKDYVQAEGAGGRPADYLNVASGYDSVQTLAAAIRATGATDGPTLAKWIEANASSLKRNMAANSYASGTSHFLSGPDALTMVQHPEQRNPDGLQKRAGC